MKSRQIKKLLIGEVESNGNTKNKYNQWFKATSTDIVQVWNVETIRESYDIAFLCCQLEFSSTVLMSYFDNIPDSFILTFLKLSPIEFGFESFDLQVPQLEADPIAPQKLRHSMTEMEKFATPIVNTHDLLSVIDSKRFDSRITKVQMDFFHGKVSGDSFYTQFTSWSFYAKYLAERQIP